MKTMRAWVLATLAVTIPLASSHASAAPEPSQPRIELSLYNTQVQLTSLAGERLPLTLGWQQHSLYARSYSEHVMSEDAQLNAVLDVPAHAQAAHGSGFAQLTVEHILGDLHGVAGFTGPTSGWATSDFIYSGNVVLTLPARSMLTMTGQIAVQADAAQAKNYVSFQRGFSAVAEGTSATRFLFDSWAPVDGYQISAVNPLDEAATFHFYSGAHGLAFSVMAVPEPASAAMAASGLLLLAALGRRRPPRRALMRTASCKD